MLMYSSTYDVYLIYNILPEIVYLTRSHCTVSLVSPNVYSLCKGLTDDCECLRCSHPEVWEERPTGKDLGFRVTCHSYKIWIKHIQDKTAKFPIGFSSCEIILYIVLIRLQFFLQYCKKRRHRSAWTKEKAFSFSFHVLTLFCWDSGFPRITKHTTLEQVITTILQVPFLLNWILVFTIFPNKLWKQN